MLKASTPDSSRPRTEQHLPDCLDICLEKHLSQKPTFKKSTASHRYRIVWEFPHVELLLNVYLQYALADCWFHTLCKQRCSHYNFIQPVVTCWQWAEHVCTMFCKQLHERVSAKTTPGPACWQVPGPYTQVTSPQLP